MMPTKQWAPRGAMLYVILTMVCFSLDYGTSFGGTLKTDAEKKEAVYTMYANYKKSFTKIADITPQKAMALSEQDQVVFVDIRKPAEMKVSRVKGAISQLEFIKNPSAYTGKTIVGYCTIGMRSGQLAKEFARDGISMLNLKGGILAWLHEGGTIVNDDGETRRLHIFGKKWDLAPDGYETMTFRFRDRFF